MSVTSLDQKWMRLALREAAKGQWLTWPNPWVGALLVKGGKVVGRGWHRGPGQEHAEAAALRVAGSKAKGATLYVTLEPCNHFGKTPPCAQAVLAAGVKRVVAACPDPNPRAKGGNAWLKRRGVAIAPWTLRDEGSELIKHFIFSASHGRPWVTLKAAASLDGRTATRAGQSKWITSDLARQDARRLRGRCEAVLVGARTVITDDPSLLPERGGWIPWRLIIDPRGRLTGKEGVFNDEHARRTVWFAPAQGLVTALERARRSACHVQPLHAGGLDKAVASAMEWMVQNQLRRVMVEGGARTLGAFLEQGWADELVLYLAPRLEGSGAGRGVFEASERGLDAWPRLTQTQIDRVGPDLRVSGLIQNNKG